MLAAPRRVGKTSFARRLIDTLSSKGWNTIFIDLEEITSIDHFFNAFYGELVKLPETKAVEKVKAKMKKWLSGVDLSGRVAPVMAEPSIATPNQGPSPFPDVRSPATWPGVVVL